MRDIRTIDRPDPKLLTLYFVSTLTLGPCFFFAFIPLYFRYHTLRYRFEEEGVAMSWGILWKREIYLTYARIQDIHLSRGLLERWLGLATIEVQTAAGKSTAEMAIVGVPEFESLRDFLYARMRGARFGQEADAGSVGALPAPGSAAPTLPSPDDPSGGGDAALGVLTDMRDTLVRIRERIERRG